MCKFVYNYHKYNELADSLANTKMEEVKDKFKIPTFGYREYKAPLTPQMKQRLSRFYAWTNTKDFNEYSDIK